MIKETRDESLGVIQQQKIKFCKVLDLNKDESIKALQTPIQSLILQNTFLQHKSNSICLVAKQYIYAMQALLPFFNNINTFLNMNKNQNIIQHSISGKVLQPPSNQHISSSHQRFPVQSYRNLNGKSLQPNQKNTYSRHQIQKVKDQHTLQSGQSQVVSYLSKHNFQKHTVVTIKKLAKRLTGQFESSPCELVANQMWNIFLSSGIKSKKILVILFGSANLNQQKYKDILKSFFFGEICNYGQGLVRRAQNILRTKVLEYLTEEVVRASILSNRHISQKQEFIAYFCEFVAILREGPLVKFRINSKISKHIDDRIRTAESLQDQRSKSIKPTANIN